MISAALVATLVGYGSTIALVLAAAAAVGADAAQTASWVAAVSVAKGLGSAVLSWGTRVPVVLALVMALLGAFDLVGDDAQRPLRHTNGMIQAALAAPDHESLPAPLRAPAVLAVPGSEHPRYTLE
jgi:hypothetical protein